MVKTKFDKSLEKYRKDADIYFASCKICPCPEEIVEYVVERVEADSGCDVDDVGYLKIAKKLGITLDEGEYNE